MELSAVKERLQQITAAYKDLAVAKEDCDIKVQAVLDALPGDVSPDEAKALKKIGKAVAGEKVDALQAETRMLDDMITAVLGDKAA